MIGKQNYQEPGVEAELNLSSLSLPLYVLNNDMGTKALRLRP